MTERKADYFVSRLSGFGRVLDKAEAAEVIARALVEMLAKGERMRVLGILDREIEQAEANSDDKTVMTLRRVRHLVTESNLSQD